jgi:RimJ/RimL family protein N-acetyltransferase
MPGPDTLWDAAVNELTTTRLLLRRWREADHEPFAALNADPLVMEHFPARLSRSESDDLIAGIEAGFDRRGYGLWALELRATGEFVGFTGLETPSFEAHFTPAVEVGWRLARSAWGHGYATEAGLASLAFGFEVAGLQEIVSFTSVVNERSRAVMERLGMTHDPGDDFDHPALSDADRLRRHVLYRRSVRDWARRTTQETVGRRRPRPEVPVPVRSRGQRSQSPDLLRRPAPRSFV